MKAACLILAMNVAAIAAQPANPGEYFELNVRPLLASKCYSCHTDVKSGGLQLDSREHMLAGGNSGPAIKPGDAGGSLLVQAIRQTHPRLKMPPGGKLADDQIGAVANWINAGAVWPAGPAKAPKYVITTEQRSFWSFQPVIEPAPPEVRDGKWIHNDLDKFILA